MTYVQVINHSYLPIHGALSWDGNLRFVVNNLKPGASHDWNEHGVFYDLTVVPGGRENQFPDKDLDSVNWKRLALQALGGAFMVTNPALALGAVLSKDGTWTLSLEKTGADGEEVVIVGPGIALQPVHVTGLYGPDGYTVHVTGGKVSLKRRSDGKFEVTGATPLAVHWENRTSHTHGDA